MKVNYDRIKEMLSIERVLNEYGLINELKRNQYKLYGKCPLHKGDNPSAFHVDLEKNLWNCFTHCGGGSVIDLLMEIEKVSVYEAGLIGEKLLQINGEEKSVYTKNNSQEKNKPLEFRLNLDSSHPYLRTRKITKKTAGFFEIGHCSIGIMRDRIAIPIHDRTNNLMAYCGRAIDNTLPKYLFPGGFKKSEIVYNLNRVIKNNNKNLVVVEGFFDVYRLYQAGFDSVAVMGSNMSENQKQQLESIDRELILMYDGDSAGQTGMKKTFDMLDYKSNVRKIHLSNNFQPDNLSENYLRKLIMQ